MPAEFFNPNQLAQVETNSQDPTELLNYFYGVAGDLADPTPELIAQYLRFYAAELSYEDLLTFRQSFLRFTLEKRELFETSDLTMQRGFDNFRILLDDVLSEFDHATCSVRDDFDPNTQAVDTYEFIRLKHAEGDLERLADEVNAERDIYKRALAAVELKDRILAFMSEFELKYTKDFDSDSPGWKEITDSFRWKSSAASKNSVDRRIFCSSFEKAIQVAHAAFTRSAFEKSLTKLPVIDSKEFDRLRSKYGAKGANLLMLNDVIGQVNRLWGKEEIKAEIPEFELIPVSVYEAWMRGENIDALLDPCFKWAVSLPPDEYGDNKGEPVDYMVRSSAVQSEDGDEKTGAGIYESVRVRGGSSFEDFKQAVMRVFRSVDSPQAREYRAGSGIADEQMGIVLQRYIYTRRRSVAGHVNSRAAGIPQLIEISTQFGRNFVSHDKLDRVLALDEYHHEEAFDESHHYQPDGDKVHGTTLIALAQVASVLERVWNRPVQLEYVEGIGIQLVQVRPLPNKWQSEVPSVEFPDVDADYLGSAIGVGDMTLSVLNSRDVNTARDGVVVFRENDMFSMSDGWKGLPKKGAVIVLHPIGSNGHIETLCSEKGLICIYSGSEPNTRIAIKKNGLRNVKTMRVVANGIEGRVYFVK